MTEFSLNRGRPNTIRLGALRPRLVLRQRTYLSVETALVTSCLVFVNQAFSSHVIQNRHSFFIRCFGRAFITGSIAEKTRLTIVRIIERWLALR